VSTVTSNLDLLRTESFCYLTTTGRTTGRPRTVEMWFEIKGTTLYMLSGGGSRSDWVRNLQRDPEVRVRLAQEELRGRARVPEDGPEEKLARRLLLEKYQPTYSGDLGEWSRSSLPVAVDLAFL
jgi:deazaflavin-dependent oxidoreductase (nitroreductase family)